MTEPPDDFEAELVTSLMPEVTEEDDLPEFWPRAGVHPFSYRSRDQRDVMASLSRFKGAEWFGYSEGYFRAAIYTLNVAAETPDEVEWLAYPIVFLFRQAMELKMKETIRECGPIVGREIPAPEGHKFTDLWKELEMLLREVWPDHPPDPVEKALGAQLRSWQNIDSSSTAFRYPERLKGGPSLHFKVLNLTVVAEVAQGIYDALNAIGTALDVERGCRGEAEQLRGEMAAEMRDGYGW